MSFVHVYKHGEGHRHRLHRGVDCRCEPRVIACCHDDAGEPARVFVHQELSRQLPPDPRLSKDGVDELQEKIGLI